MINEVIAYNLLKHFGISTPEIRLLELPETTEGIEQIYFSGGGHLVRRGPHFGSQAPVDPEKKVIFDFLPEHVLHKITNLEEFAMMFVLDKWLYQTDSRQTIFIRDPKVRNGVGFKVFFIDHGNIMGGKEWELRDVPLYGLPLYRRIYSLLDMRKLTRAGVEALSAIPFSLILSATEGIPGEWFRPGDREQLMANFCALDKRRHNLSGLVSRHLDALNV